MLTIKQILISTQGQLRQGYLKGSVSGVCINSRLVKPRNLFVAIKGEHHDSHRFIPQAIAQGAFPQFVERIRASYSEEQR